jgi:two-component system sensor histidine kinase/response regulator
MLLSQDTKAGAVLVVDDNPLIVTVVKNLLGAANFDVFTASDGQQALELLEKKSVDVIVCDVMMPTMDGYQLHNAVRTRGPLSHIPFVFLTALDDAAEVHSGKETGVDDYLVKPFDPRNLLAVVRGKVARARGIKNASEERFEAYRKKVVHLLSHEFRTPLVAINSGTEILIDHKDKLDPNKVASLLDAIARGGKRLERIVTDFMVLQQIEAGIAQRLYDSRAAARNAEALLHQFMETNRPELEHSGFDVRVEANAPQAWVKVYEPHIWDILDRLVSNVRKFVAHELIIEFAVRQEGARMIFEVRDRGIGMDTSQVEQATDLFGQIDRDKREQQGTGLGLAIATRYATINGGKLNFESRVGGGTTAALILPLFDTPDLP